MVMSIDNFLLAFVIFILEILEYLLYKRKSNLNKMYQESDYTILKKQNFSNVMSIANDESSIINP